MLVGRTRKLQQDANGLGPRYLVFERPQSAVNGRLARFAKVTFWPMVLGCVLFGGKNIGPVQVLRQLLVKPDKCAIPILPSRPLNPECTNALGKIGPSCNRVWESLNWQIQCWFPRQVQQSLGNGASREDRVSPAHEGPAKAIAIDHAIPRMQPPATPKNCSGILGDAEIQCGGIGLGRGWPRRKILESTRSGKDQPGVSIGLGHNGQESCVCQAGKVGPESMLNCPHIRHRPDVLLALADYPTN